MTVSLEDLKREARDAIVTLTDGEWLLPCDIPGLLDRLLSALPSGGQEAREGWVVQACDELIAKIPSLSIHDQWRHGYMAACEKIKSLAAAPGAAPEPTPPLSRELQMVENMKRRYPCEMAPCPHVKLCGMVGRCYGKEHKAHTAALLAELAPAPAAEPAEDALVAWQSIEGIKRDGRWIVCTDDVAIWLDRAAEWSDFTWSGIGYPEHRATKFCEIAQPTVRALSAQQEETGR